MSDESQLGVEAWAMVWPDGHWRIYPDCVKERDVWRVAMKIVDERSIQQYENHGHQVKRVRVMGLSDSCASPGSVTKMVHLIREDKVWHVWIDGHHASECCDCTFSAMADRLKAWMARSPNK